MELEASILPTSPCVPLEPNHANVASKLSPLSSKILKSLLFLDYLAMTNID